MSLTQKPLEEYEYKVKIHEINPDTGTVLLLFEEVDGLDGFGVEIPMDELKRLKAEKRFEEWVVEQVEKRLDFLEDVKAKEEAKKKLEEEIKAEIEDEEIKEKKVKSRKRSKVKADK